MLYIYNICDKNDHLIDSMKERVIKNSIDIIFYII